MNNTCLNCLHELVCRDAHVSAEPYIMANCKYYMPKESRATLPDNKALTVDELREMSGKSAWFDAGEPFGIKPCIIKRVEGWQLKEQAYDPKHPMMTWFWMFNTEGEMRSFDAEYAMMIGRKFYRRPPDKGA